MKTKQIMLLVLAACVCIFTGCAAIGSRAAFDDRYFSGTHLDCVEIFENNKLGENVRAPRTLAAIDLPFSFAADVILLPFDVVNPAAREAAHDLPVEFQYPPDGRHSFVLKNYAKKDLPLTLTIRDWDGDLKLTRTNLCHLDLPAGATRQISPLSNWEKHGNIVKVEIACPDYSHAQYYIDY